MPRLLLRALFLLAFVVQSASALDGSYAGAWWDPERAGEGIFFEIVEQPDGPYVVAYWFTYADDDSGSQAYLVGQGAADGNRVVLETVTTRGGRFGAEFGEAVEFIPWGTLTADFTGCEAMILSYEGSSSGTIQMTRFKTPPLGIDGDCAAPTGEGLAAPEVSAIDGAYFGAWWLPTRAGEGLFLEVWADQLGLPQLFAAWFTYAPDDSGAQAWVVGEGPIHGNRADLTAIITSGPSFGPDFDAARVGFAPWGYLSVRFLGCGQVEASFDAPGFGQGTLAQEPFLLPMAGAPDCRQEVLDFRNEVIYFAFTDRFHNGDPGNDDEDGLRSGDSADPSNPLGWHGGDFAGIGEKIESGYFRDLGVTMLWISPVHRQVPSVPVNSGPNAGRRFAGYHGYWADRFEAIEPHFGTAEELRQLVSTAHRNGLKVIFDTVVNHVGYDSSLIADHPDWFRTGSSCGSSDTTLCLAGLPDIRQDVPAAADFLDGQVRYWLESSGADGMRMDTMKHVDDDYWRRFFVAGGSGDPARWWTIGEVFSGDIAQVGRFIDELGSPSVFDFPLYMGIVDAMARGESITRISDVFAADDRHGDPSRLTTFVDNHDVPRFMTQARNAGYSEAQARERLDTALSLIFFARGIPSIYYGTEIAMAGGGDPYDFALGESNREDMDFDALAASSMDERLAALSAARAAHPVLRYGSQRTLYAPGSGCSVDASTLDPAADFGAEMYLRGTFNGWAAPPSAAFVNQGGGRYLSAVSIDGASHEYKVGSGDWSIEYGNPSQTLRVGQSVTLSRAASGGGPNSRMELTADGCYRFELQAGADNTATLSVSGPTGAAADQELFVFVREAAEWAPVLVLVNNQDVALDLSELGGIEVAGLLVDGLPREVTGQSHALVVSGGRLDGTIPARSVLALTNLDQ